MYNKPLCTYLQDQFSEDDRSFIQTFDYWIYNYVTHSPYADAKISGIMNKINKNFTPKKKYNADCKTGVSVWIENCGSAYLAARVGTR